MRSETTATLLVFLFSLSGAHEHQAGGDNVLGTSYRFSRQLHSRYTLYWNFNTSARTIQFAVRVQTTGWVGFGLSPNGQMPGSDVVIGWVNQQGEVVFHVSEKL